MSITVSNQGNSGNVTNSQTATVSHTCAANTKCIVAIITGYDSSNTDAAVIAVSFPTSIIPLARASSYRSGSAFIAIYYLPLPSVGLAGNVYVQMGGTCTDLQVTVVDLVSTTSDVILYDSVQSGISTTTSHSLIVNPAKAGSVALGGIVDVQSAVSALSVTSGYGTEIPGSEADMGSQVVGCAYNSASGTTAEIRWSKSAAATSYALICTFYEQHYPTIALGTPDNGATGVSINPALNFTGSDSDSDTLEYHVQVHNDNSFGGWSYFTIAPSTDYYSVAVDSANNDVYFAQGITNGAIYKSLGGTGTPSIIDDVYYSWWYTVAVNSVTKDVYGIHPTTLQFLFKQTGGVGSFVAQSQPGEYTWDGFAIDESTGDLYAVARTVAPGVYKRPSGSADFSLYYSISGAYHIAVDSSNGDIFLSTTYALYKQTGGSGNFNLVTDFLDKFIYDIRVDPNTHDVWLNTDAGYIYVYRGGQSTPELFVSLGLNVRGFDINTSTKQMFVVLSTTAYPYRFIPPLIDKNSASDAGFTSGHPFTQAVEKSFTVQSANTLTYNTVYYWRARAVDPSGSGVYSSWSEIRSFTTSSGGTWSAKSLKVYLGGTWVAKPLKQYTGGTWTTKLVKKIG